MQTFKQLVWFRLVLSHHSRLHHVLLRLPSLDTVPLNSHCGALAGVHLPTHTPPGSHPLPLWQSLCLQLSGWAAWAKDQRQRNPSQRDPHVIAQPRGVLATVQPMCVKKHNQPCLIPVSVSVTQGAAVMVGREAKT